MTNGTDAITLALQSLSIGADAEVITAVNTFAATAEAVTRAGAKVRFVDVEEQTLNLDSNQVEDAITPHTRAIIPVHLFGQSANMDAILDIARRWELLVIEDALSEALEGAVLLKS